MAKIIVSNCLLGCKCRYLGDGCKNADIVALSKNHILIGICPEQFGGLPTPRIPSEIVGEKVLNAKGQDVTEQYIRGAEISLHLAKINNVDFAILKARSPSCGKGKVYDGSFSNKLRPGNGITAQLFINNGIKVYTEEEIDAFPPLTHQNK